MSIYKIQPRDFSVTQGERAGLGDVVGASFRSSRSVGNVAENQRHMEAYSGYRQIFDSVIQGNLDLPEEIAQPLFEQDFSPDEETLGRLSQWIQTDGQQFGYKVTPDMDPAAVIARRDQLYAETQQSYEKNQEIISRAGPATRAFGGLVGGIGAEMTDPANIAMSLVGAPARVSFLGLVGIEAAINAGIEAAQTPGRNRVLREIGQEEESVVTNALFGAAFGGVFAGIMRGIQTGAPSAYRAAAPLFRRREIRGALLESTALSRDPVIQTAREAVIRDVEDEAAAVTNPETPGAVAEHEQRIEEASRALTEGRAPDLPDRPTLAQPRGSIVNGLIEEVDPAQLKVQPEIFQFKSEIVAEGGVTPKLLKVTEWAPERAGIVVVYEYGDGTRAIADGHQRTALASRIMAQDPSQKITMAARVYREADGFTTEDVRVIAALKNISESADGMTVQMARDAAKVLRIRPDAISQLPTGPGIGRAENLSRLSDDAFQLYINEVVPERFAELVGKMVDDPSLHLAMMRLLERVRPETTTQAESILAQALQAPVSRETTADLFGEQEIAESLYLERAKVLEKAMAILRDDRSVYRTLTERQGRIEGSGNNRLDAGTNKEIRQATEQALGAIKALAHRAGPISEALNDGATSYKSTGRLKDAAERVATAVRDEISRNGLAGGGAGARGQAAQSANAGLEAPDANEGFSEPGGVGAQEQIAATRSVLSDPTPSRVAQTLREMNRGGGRVMVRKEDIGPEEFRALDRALRAEQPGESLEEYHQLAAANHDALNDEAQKIADSLGLTFFRAPLKTIERTAEKVATKYDGEFKKMGDVARAGVTVNTPDDAEAFIAALGKRFHVVDEGWTETPAGYFDAKLIVRFDDGQIGEFQFWPPGMFDAKEFQGGHAMYEEARLPETTPERKAELELEMRALYGAALAELDESWSRFGGGVAPNSLNMRPSSDGGTSMPRSSDSTARAVASEGSDQDPLEAFQTEATLRTEETAARLDTSVNTSFMGDTSRQDVTTVAAGRNSESTAAGDQVLIEGVDPITERQRLEALQARPMGGGPRRDDTHIGGLFDPLDPVRNDLFDRVPVGREIDSQGNELALTRSKAELRAELDAEDEFADQLGFCLKD